MSKKRSRTTNTIFNFTSSLGGQMIALLNHFIVRTVFIHTLGKSYLGIEGLFSNILTLFSLAEFGVGEAILFKLYDPLAKNDIKRIQVLMKFYRSAYRMIGLLIAAIGLCFIPFLPMLIKDYDKLKALDLNAALIYSLYLLKTISSYLFFAYRSAIIKADQKEYMVNVIGYGFSLGKTILQVITLVLFKSFIVFVLIYIVEVIAYNIMAARMSDRMYPYIKENIPDSISKKETKEILKDCGVLFLYKLNHVVVKATDNIVLSAFLGLDSVALYANYLMLYTTIYSLFSRIFGSVAHSLGNLHAAGKREHEYRVFETVMLITAILGGTAFAGVYVCSDELILAWIGEEWMLPQPFALLMGIELFTAAYRSIFNKYRSSMGLFRQAKLRPVLGMVVNLVVSVALVNVWGICGVLVGTIAADWAVMIWYDPLLVHRVGFEGAFPFSRFLFKFMKNFLVVSAVAAFDRLLCLHFLAGCGFISFFVHAMICAVTVPGILIAINIKTPEGRYAYEMIKTYANKLKKKAKLKR